MKNKINIIFIVTLIILIVGIIFLYIRNISLKNELMNIKNSNLETTEEVERDNDIESEEITEEQAIGVVENYRINTLQDTTNSYKFQKIEKEIVDIENRYLATNGNYLINIEKSKVNVYAVYYSFDDNTDMFTGYVDINSGKLLGIHGEGV